MVEQESAVPGILGLEEAYLVVDEILDDIAVAGGGKGDEPGAAGKRKCEQIHAYVLPSEVQTETLESQPEEECQRED